AKGGLANTLFEKIIRTKKIGSLLKVQYRMNEKIMNFSNGQFYDNALTAHESVINHTLLPEEEALEFIDTAGGGFGEQMNPETLSRYNKEEADFLLRHLQALLRKVLESEINSNAAAAISIGII